METLTITFNPDHELSERVEYMEEEVNQLKGMTLVTVNLDMGNEPDVNYGGYDSILKKMLLIHAKAMIIEYEKS